MEDGSIIVVGSKQVQVLDLVIESDTMEDTKSIVTTSCLPPRKKPKISVNLYSPDALVMPEPDIDHQVN